ncbi:MAG: hypothetical protein M1820_010515 [Bogoriella megaspora]|nr:MAG: hypothetical protein M1820_010515 [Bogoriella megaspora]
MFRNPRENADLPLDAIPAKPSVGRPPSPVSSTPSNHSTGLRRSEPQQATLISLDSMPSKIAQSKQAKIPLSTKSTNAALPSGKNGSAKKMANGKTLAKPNGSILNFFQKTERPEDNTLFLARRIGDRSNPVLVTDAGVEALNKDGILEEQNGFDDCLRFNEISSPSKRRKVEPDEDGLETKDAACTPPPPDLRNQQTAADGLYAGKAEQKAQQKSGPFIDDSDSDDESPITRKSLVVGSDPPKTAEVDARATAPATDDATDEHGEPETIVPERHIPSLKNEETSYGDLDGFNDFEGMEDFDDDEYALGGEEYMERRYLEEQRILELEEGGTPDANISANVIAQPSTPKCPICGISMKGVSDQDAMVHVNHCLDGNPTPLPTDDSLPSALEEVKAEPDTSAAKFKRPVRAAKPGQENPFQFGEAHGGSSSAFSKLMSGHAEDAAWATAAAAEHASRGKPAYQRTCPFYKILPGLSICVDAFRYGAVQGCQAYFLSHFHSDHYIGLTSNWCHGPIYCSKVTGNLVRQQLRVDPRWVVDLEFEEKREVPRTNGVAVTMIPANHCPGSSLFLFEKIIGKGKNPKVQRILHCGDFRACRAHIDHSLLSPDVMDTVTGKSRQQKIDVCYLDTTYLNPKYAFPSQAEVIKACADMCVSLNKVRADEDDGWEQMKRMRAGSGMVKFVHKESDPDIKQEDETDDANLDEDDKDAMKVIKKGISSKNRGRLLVVVGTYSIGKERICLGIAKALGSKIYAPPGKQRICACLEDPELSSRLTSDPREAQVHMTPLFEIRAETLDDYLKDYKEHFSRAVGFRPSGWNYRPPNSRFTESPSVSTVLNSDNWKSMYTMRELVPQRGSTSRASCFGVPYSEHSSFRELTMFCCALRIDKIIPTVNVGSAKSRGRMKEWCERWAMEKRKNGLWKVEDGKW